MNNALTSSLILALMAASMTACNAPATPQSKDPITLAYTPGLIEVRVQSQTGETFEAVALRIGIEAERLRGWNPSAPHDLLPAGTVIRAWVRRDASSTGSAS